jgi:hypothetical protein
MLQLAENGVSCDFFCEKITKPPEFKWCLVMSIKLIILKLNQSRVFDYS